MEFLGIGPLEFFFIIIIALIILGPKDMVKAGKTIGSFLRKVLTSEGWQTVQAASRELRNLPEKLMNEAGIEDIQEEMNSIKQIGQKIGDEVQQDLNQVEGLVTEISDQAKSLHHVDIGESSPAESPQPMQPEEPPLTISSPEPPNEESKPE